MSAFLATISTLGGPTTTGAIWALSAVQAWRTGRRGLRGHFAIFTDNADRKAHLKRMQMRYAVTGAAILLSALRVPAYL